MPEHVFQGSENLVKFLISLGHNAYAPHLGTAWQAIGHAMTTTTTTTTTAAASTTTDQ